MVNWTALHVFFPRNKPIRCQWHIPSYMNLHMFDVNPSPLGEKKEAKSRLKILEKCQDTVKKILETTIMIYFVFSFFKFFFIRNAWSVDLQNINGVFKNIHRRIRKIIFVCLLKLGVKIRCIPVNLFGQLISWMFQ